MPKNLVSHGITIPCSGYQTVLSRLDTKLPFNRHFSDAAGAVMTHPAHREMIVDRRLDIENGRMLGNPGTAWFKWGNGYPQWVDSK